MQVYFLAAALRGRTQTVNSAEFLSVGMSDAFSFDVCGVFLPACLTYTGNFALVSKFTEADTADAVFAQVRMGTSANFAAGILSGGVFLLLLLL